MLSVERGVDNGSPLATSVGLWTWPFAPTSAPVPPPPHPLPSVSEPALL